MPGARGDERPSGGGDAREPIESPATGTGAATAAEHGDAGVGVRAGRAQRVWALNGVLLGL